MSPMQIRKGETYWWIRCPLCGSAPSSTHAEALRAAYQHIKGDHS